MILLLLLVSLNSVNDISCR